jgi:nitrogen fixation/metabolism regulation signal transduction histidine kinase
MPLQTLSNLLAALREGDYSIRGRAAKNDDPLGDVVREINALSSTLRTQRLGAMEATALLRTVMAEIEVAIFAFDSDRRLRLVNRAGERLLDRPSEQLLGRTAEDLHMGDCLEGEQARTLQRSFPGGFGRWGMRRSTFREGGKPHQLVVLADLSRALREEERLAWQRLVRVIGHELNNSLAPIKSIAGSLENLFSRTPRPPDWEEDVQSGLSVIAARAEALNRFMTAYAKLAKLPRPELRPMEIGFWVRQVVGLETRMKINLLAGPELTIQGDSDQLEQVLINLVRNAVDAASETGGGVLVSWHTNNGFLEVLVEDEGPGLSNTSNLFVPFFTTKPSGSGIGLALTKRLVEVHGSIEHSVCMRCGGRVRLEQVIAQVRAEGGAPECPACVLPLKPDVVLFGELLPEEAMSEAQALALDADLMICVGSSLEVYPVAGLPAMTRGGGGRLALVTQGPTPYDGDAEVKLDGDVVEELRAVLAALE